VGEEEQEDFKRGVLGQADKLKHWISDKVDQRVHDVLKMMKLVSREEYDAVKASVSSLQERVDALEKKGDPDAS
jgi:polyhydroxyalkanoate synthesis regulator phasin